MLLERGAGVDSIDGDGNSALLRLLSHGGVTLHVLKVLRVLFSFGASCTLRNNEGKTAVDMPLYKDQLLARRIDETVREENWCRRRGIFLVLARHTVTSDNHWETERGASRI